MKVGTDGVLLGAWAELEEAASILDIGTGTGLIALMAAQRNAQARIDALEIEPAACREAAYNIRISPWAERIRLYPQALQAFFPAIVMTVSFVILLFSYTPHRHRITAVV